MSGLQRFTEAQERDFDTALAEIRNGHKRTHWIWKTGHQNIGYSGERRKRIGEKRWKTICRTALLYM